MTAIARVIVGLGLGLGLGLGVASPNVAAARMISVPTIPQNCPGAPSWPKVATCLAKFGRVAVLKSSTGMRLVQLSRDAANRGGYRTPGMYLYKEINKRWVLGGMHEGAGFSLVASTTFKVGRFTGHRFDLRTTDNHDVMIHGQQRRAQVRQTVAVYCSGQSHVCSQVMLACDVYVEGKSYWTFRGTPEIADNRLLVRGDRSNTGSECVQEAESWLPGFAE